MNSDNGINLLGDSSNNLLLIIIISVLTVAVIVSSVIAIVAFKKARLKDKTEKDNYNDINLVDGVRYTKSNESIVNGKVNTTLNPNDIILEKGKEYNVEIGGKIIPGKYKILSCEESVNAFNMKIGDFVREYRHSTEVILTENTKITAVSHSVILR